MRSRSAETVLSRSRARVSPSHSANSGLSSMSRPLSGSLKIASGSGSAREASLSITSASRVKSARRISFLFATIFSGKFLRSRQSALRRLPAACFSFLSPHSRKAIFSFGAQPSEARKKSSASAFLKGSCTASPSFVTCGSPKKEKFRDIARAPSVNLACTQKL